MTKTDYRYDPDTKDPLVVAQLGDLRVIGIRIFHDIVPGQTENVALYNVGAIITTRGAMPGKLAGTVLMTKSVSIVPLDFATGPISKMVIELKNHYTVGTENMKKEDVQTFVEQYNMFLSGESHEVVSRAK